MTPEQQKEEISKADIHAVAASCGYKVGTWSQDAGCLDVSIGAEGALGGGTMEDPQLDLQLKCSSKKALSKKGADISWQLDKSHYDKLRSTHRSKPIILVVLVLPEKPEQWVRHYTTNPRRLVLRRCAYWANLRGAAARKAAKPTVTIPLSQPFSPESLRAMLENISRGVSP
jgi:hypothetical protein